MNKRTLLSIIIITGNEEKMITDCLKSCKFADEVILVDNNSTDKTTEIAQKTIPKIIIKSIKDNSNCNFSHWRNLGFKISTGLWILYLDTDERITPALRKEIQSVIRSSNNKFTNYDIPRANYFLGKRVKFGGTYPDYVKRLFKRDSFKGYRGILHEQPDIIGQSGILKNNFIHLTHRDLISMLNKSIKWTKYEAKLLYDDNHPPIVWWRLIRMMITKLFDRLILQNMWRDGTVGWISVIFESFDTFMIYAQLWELQQKNYKIPS